MLWTLHTFLLHFRFWTATNHSSTFPLTLKFTEIGSSSSRPGLIGTGEEQTLEIILNSKFYSFNHETSESSVLKTMWFSLCDKLEIVGRYGRSVAVIWSQVIWGQGWGPGRGMNLNNGSPQTLVIGVRLCNSKTQLCGLPSHKRKLRHENMAQKYLVQPYFAETRRSILDLDSVAQESLKIWARMMKLNLKRTNGTEEV